MSRGQRAGIANETVAICDAGYYTSPSGRRVELGSATADAVEGTVLYSPENPPRIIEAKGKPTRMEVVNETAFNAVARLSGRGGHIGCLNFASAKNPGGGFLNGAQAQEEALARASALYQCLLAAPAYYERNRGHRSALYLDLVIFSPQVPFFRNDSGTLLEKPVLASVVTAPAPNAGAIAQNEPHNLQQVEPTLRRRSELVLGVAQAHGVERLVLGAWGCGVFRNEPRKVATIFRELLETPGKFAGSFDEVVFAVYDRGENHLIYRAFSDVFRGIAERQRIFSPSSQ